MQLTGINQFASYGAGNQLGHNNIILYVLVQNLQSVDQCMHAL